MGAVMELGEVDQKKVNNIMFKRIGVDVPILSKSEGFESDHLPARALAISNCFGYTVFAHSRGFSVAKTADLVEVAQKLDVNADGFKTAQEAGTVTVDVTNIRSLALSSDELTVCVCVGGDVIFYELATLVHKSESPPFEFWQVDRNDDSYAKDFLWSPSNSEAYLVVTSRGKLLLGRIGSVAECKVEEGVVAASWSADGQHLAYASDNLLLSITTTNFATTFQYELPTHLSDEDDDCDLHGVSSCGACACGSQLSCIYSLAAVDAIRWVRPDSIVIGFLQVNSEGEEDEYPLFVLNSRIGNLAQEGSNLLGLVFYQLFPSVDPFVVPSGSGPYMLSDYVKPWELMVAASRKSIDDHIVLMGWFPEDGRDVLYSLELGNDVWIPRIELQESSEDNAILGLAIDRTTVQIELSDPTDESGDTKLPPCPVLVCLTLEGKLSFFSVARLGEQSKVPDLVTPPSNVPDTKWSIPQPSSQLTSKAVTTTTLFPASPTVVKVEPPKDVLSSSELTAQAEAVHQGEANKEAPSQSGFRTKPDVKDERDSLFERLTSASPSFPQGDHRSEGSRLGSTLFSETKKSMGMPTSPSVTTLRDLTGAVNVASTLEGLFRPFDDASNSGPVTVKAAPPLQVPWGLQLPSASSSLPVTASGPLQSVQNGPVPTASAQGKDFEGGPAANATVSFGLGSQGKGFQGGAAANPTVSLVPGLQGKGFQRGPAANLSSPFGLGSRGKGFQQRPATNSTVSFDVGSQGKVLQGGNVPNPNGSSGSGSQGNGLQEGPTGNSTAAFGASVKNPIGSTVAPKVVSSQRGADRFSHSSRILQEQQSAGRAPGVTDLEAAFNAELEEVRNMSEEVDHLMSYIEGRWQGNANETPVSFTKQALEELEQGIHHLSEECKAFRVQLNKNKEAIDDLRDEEMRVDSWRIYIQSLMDQKNDSRYQELWNSQKLHPELEMKRKRLLKADQELKQHIAELEGHLHILELKQFQQGNARRRTSKPSQSPGRFLSVQNLYNTVNSQMAIAEELSNSLAKQMEALNIRWSPQTPKSTASKILKSVGADTDESENLLSPLPPTRLSYSPAPKTGSMNDFSAFSGQEKEPNLQETRRRRDTMDAAWVNRETPKTTIKRVVRTRPSQKVSPNDPTVPKFRQWRQASSDVLVTEKSHFSQNAQPVQSTGMDPHLALQSFSDPGFEESAHSFRKADIFNSTPQGPSSQSQAQLEVQPHAQPQAQAKLQAKLQAKPQAQPQAQLQAQLRAKLQAQSQAQLQAKSQAPLQAKSQPQPQAQPQAQQTGPGPTFPSADLKGSSSAAYQGSAGQVMNTNSKESMFKWANSTAISKPVTSVAKQSSGSVFASSSAPAVSVVPAKTATTSIFSAQTGSTGLFSGSSSISNATQASSSSGFTWSTTLVPKQSSGSRFTSSSVPAVLAAGTPATTATASTFSAPPVTAGLFSGSSSTSNATQDSSSSRTSSSTSITSVFKPSSGSLVTSSSVPEVTVAGISATTAATSIFSGSSSTSNATQASTSSGSALITSATPVAGQSSGSIFVSSSVPAISAVGSPATQATTSIFSAQTVSAGLFSGSSSTSDVAQAFASSGSAFSTSTPSMPNQSSGSLFASSSVPAFQTSSTQSISPSPFGQSSFGQSSPFGQAPQQHIHQPFISPGSSASSTISNVTVALPPAESNEEDMEEEVSTSTAGLGTFGGFGGLGLGSSAPGAHTQKANPFGGSSFGNSQPFQLTPPTGGQLFRPATFRLPAAQSSPQQSGGSTFGSGFGSSGFSQNNLFSETGKGFGSPPQSAGGFGQPAQLGPGQQALGSALGAFGQTRQVGFGTPFGNSGVGSASGGGFGNTSPGGGFASAATGGGFTKAAAGGGFAGAAMGGGFAGAATGGGFAAAASGGGFGSAGGAGGGFGGLAGGGFQAFSGNQAASPGFGSGVPPAQTSLFTQMRK